MDWIGGARGLVGPQRGGCLDWGGLGGFAGGWWVHRGGSSGG